MKSSIVIFILTLPIVFASNNGNCQSLVQQGKKWAYLLANNIPDFELHNDRCLQIIGDTLIASAQYSKLIDFFGCNEENGKINGFMRETTDSLVFYRPWYSNKEYLLYDFRIKVGDSIFTTPAPCRLDSIGTTLKGQRIFYLSGAYNFKDKWIEGVGSEMGLLMEVLTGETMIFTCCFSGNTELYHNPDYPGCFYTSANTLNNEQSDIELTSTQNGVIEIQLMRNSKGAIFFYTLDGKLVLNKKLDDHEIKLQSPVKGILLYNFISEKGKMQTGKLFIK